MKKNLMQKSTMLRLVLPIVSPFPRLRRRRVSEEEFGFSRPVDAQRRRFYGRFLWYKTHVRCRI